MWSSHATRRQVAYHNLHARQGHKAVILHTNGGGSDHGSLYGWWTAGARGDHGKDNLHVGAHFQVMSSGHAEQYVDTSLVVYHAYGASEWAVGIETEDDDHPSTPWTGPQLNTIIAICKELHVPGRLLLDSPSDGVGWHEQYRDWNQSGHDCPGTVRERQIHDVILPALRQPAPKPTPAPVPHTSPPVRPSPGEDIDMFMIEATGDPAVYLVDTGGKRHVGPDEYPVYFAAGIKKITVTPKQRDAIPNR